MSYRRNKFFNIVTFNDEVRAWSASGPVKASTTLTSDAISWLNSIKAWGGTNILKAVEEAFCQIVKFKVKGKAGIYLITDGCPDYSCAKTEEMIVNKYREFEGLSHLPRIHTIDCARERREEEEEEEEKKGGGVIDYRS